MARLNNSLPWDRWPIEIDGLPINSMVIFQSELLVISRWYYKRNHPQMALFSFRVSEL